MRHTLRHVVPAACVAVLAFTGSALVAFPLPLPPPPPNTITVTAVVRDFKGLDEVGGHPDMQRANDPRPGGGGMYQIGMVEPVLGADKKPVFVDHGATHVLTQWLDYAGRPISRLMYDPAIDGVGNTGTTLTTVAHGCFGGDGDNGYITSAATFDQLFRDVPGVNTSAALPITFVEQLDGTYVFDDKTDPAYSTMGGFFPIDNTLYGNYPTVASASGVFHNYHFTVELHSWFTYDAAGGHTFRFVGDDDMWVFINGKLVIDIGGHHYPREELVELDRLGLTDGQNYSMDIFYCERRTRGSNLHITTTLLLQNGPGPVSVSACWD